MIKTLYVRSGDADRCTESFQASIPITVTGINATDEYVSALKPKASGGSKRLVLSARET
jgi:hypothetical protein